MNNDNNSKIFPKLNKPAWNIFGSIFVAIGIIGIFIPLLPTTPFLLLAAYCFNRGSEKMRLWFNNNSLIKPYIDNYKKKQGIPLRAKMNSLVLLWITVGISIYFVSNIYLRIILVLVIIGVTIHLVRIPTIKN